MVWHKYSFELTSAISYLKTINELRGVWYEILRKLTRYIWIYDEMGLYEADHYFQWSSWLSEIALTLQYIPRNMHTVFAVLCCGYTLTDFPISIRLTSLALWQSNDCPSASKATLMNMDKYFMWIHYERLHNHNKAKHNKTVCIFLGIYCKCMTSNSTPIKPWMKLRIIECLTPVEVRAFMAQMVSNVEMFSFDDVIMGTYPFLNLRNYLLKIKESPVLPEPISSVMPNRVTHFLGEVAFVSSALSLSIGNEACHCRGICNTGNSSYNVFRYNL